MSLQAQRTVECKHCANKSPTPPMVQYTITPTDKPRYCPTCAHPRVVRPFDYADVLCESHAGLSRQLAISIINTFNEQQARRNIPRQVDVIDYIRDLTNNNQGFMTMQQAVTPLNVACHECGGSYTLLRNLPQVQRTPPLYCIWCASANITIMQQSTDETAETVLADHYNLSVPIFRVFYERWTTHSRHTTFDAYMHSPTTKEILRVYNEMKPEYKTEVTA